MLTKRIIPCLDVLNGRVVKGKRFVQLTDVGDPVELASRYSREGADELVLLDISASIEDRRPFFQIVREVAQSVAIPLTVGGGIRTMEDVLELLRCGADKVSLNTILYERPSILAEVARRVGSQALVAAIDAKRRDGFWSVHSKSGTKETLRDAVEWARTLVGYGAGELLVTSIDRDGMRQGYDLELLSRLSDVVNVPIVASGGAGNKDHLVDALKSGKADAVLAASLFHCDEMSIHDIKQYLHSHHIAVRL